MNKVFEFALFTDKIQAEGVCHGFEHDQSRCDEHGAVPDVVLRRIELLRIFAQPKTFTLRERLNDD